MLLTVDAVEIRNRMRSVDDLMYYGRWKRESLRALRDRKHNGDSVKGGAGVSLNQSYSGASVLTATDDEERAGPTQRRGRRIRLRRRDGGSIVSAPVKPQINLDDSVGSAALDVDSMFRFLASSAPTPVAAADVGIRSSKPVRLPPTGLPPSGRTTSARRTSLRRRRRPMSSSVTDVTDDSTTSFDNVPMTSSTVDLKEATTTGVVAPDSFGVQLSRPVRRSQRRRRRTTESPSRATARDFAEASVAMISSAPTNVTDIGKPEALWELCGEKLNQICRRILKIGVMDTENVANELMFRDNKTKPERMEVEVVQLSGVVEQSSPCNEAPGSPVSERKRDEDAYCSDDVTDYRPSSDDVPQLDQQTTRSSGQRQDGCSDAENAATDIGGSVIRPRDDDDKFSSRSTPPTAAVDDARDGVRTTAGHVPPLNDQLDTAQFQSETSTCSSELCRELDESTPSCQLTTDRTLLAIGENHAVQRIGEQTSSFAEEHPVAPGLDISAMLSPSIELRDILDTIYTLTGGDVDDETPSPPPRGLPSKNPATSGDENACPQEDDRQRLPDDTGLGQAAAVCLDGDDDDIDSLLDLDAEMYEYDLSPAAADLADSLHLPIAEDDDYDIDIADYEYELDDDDVL